MPWGIKSWQGDPVSWSTVRGEQKPRVERSWGSQMGSCRALFWFLSQVKRTSFSDFENSLREAIQMRWKELCVDEKCSFQRSNIWMLSYLRMAGASLGIQGEYNLHTKWRIQTYLMTSTQILFWLFLFTQLICMAGRWGYGVLHR